MLLRYFIALLLGLANSANAQSIEPATRPGDPVISIITMGPGRLVYERYGHVAIRVQAPINGLDVAFDWGNFDFNAPGFIGTFVKGDLRYWMEGKDAEAFIRHYAKVEDRTVTIRELNLTHDQAYRVVDIIRNQDDEAHRYYAYDYYKDNCSTRVRDVINEATGGALDSAKQAITPFSYRWHNRRLLRVGIDNVAIMTGMEIATGPRLDGPLAEWDAAYLPTLLGETLDRTKFADGRPLVREKRVVNETSTSANFEPTEATNPALWTLPIGLVFGGILIVLSRKWPTGFCIGATAWELFVLVAAIFLPTVILFTRHWPVAWNENFLQFTPLSIPLFWILWQRKRDSGWGRLVPAVAFGLSGLGALVTISHMTPQHNAPAVCLALPLHAAVYVGLKQLRKGSRHESIDTSSLAPLPAT